MMNAVVLGSAGSIGRRHVRNLRELGVGVAECDPVVYPDNAMPDWRVVAKDNVVVVASPTIHHWEQALMAIDYGARAVYVEKPPAQATLEWLQVIAAAKESDCKLAVGFNYRFHPAAQVLRDMGPIRRATFVALDDFFHWPPTGRDHLMADGVLACSGSHTIDLVQHLYGPLRATKAMGGDLTVMTNLEGPARVVTTVNTWATPVQASTAWGELADGRYFELDIKDEKWLEYTKNSMHRDCMAAFVNWADLGQLDPRTCTGEDALQTMEILDQCRNLLS